MVPPSDVTVADAKGKRKPRGYALISQDLPNERIDEDSRIARPLTVPNP